MYIPANYGNNLEKPKGNFDGFNLIRRAYMKKDKRNILLPFVNIINCKLKLKTWLHNKFPAIATKDTVSSENGNPANGNYRRGLLAIILLILMLPSLFLKANAQGRSNHQADIAAEIIRFHVIANSDSQEDQALKLAVKSVLVDKLAPYLQDAGSKDEARQIIYDKMDYIGELAKDTISRQGFNYPVKVTLEEDYFPLRIYGDYAFPPGNYEALRVEIGQGKGKNWWCVMFPPLCFVDETYSIVDESSGQKLKYLLTEEDYEALKLKKVPVKIRFKLLQIIKDFFNKG